MVSDSICQFMGNSTDDCAGSWLEGDLFSLSLFWGVLFLFWFRLDWIPGFLSGLSRQHGDKAAYFFFVCICRMEVYLYLDRGKGKGETSALVN